MYKEIILLTSSKKRGNYCIAGVEKQTGNWVRIISEDDTIQHAVTDKDMKYEDGNMPQVMDIIKIKCKAHSPNYYQPENYIFDNKFYWGRMGKATIEELLTIRPSESKSLLFYDTGARVEEDYVKGIDNEEKYSLILISPEDVCIDVKHWPERIQVTMSFNYNGNRYKYIPITDGQFLNIYQQYPEGNYNYQEDCLLVMSLGDLHTDKKHYKLIAKILNI